LPRRYQPPARRRKLKKGQFSQEAAAPIAAAPVAPPLPVAAPVAAQQGRPPEGWHNVRDHSYVRGDLRRLAIITAFIGGGLVITAIIR
jgi:hypothetical protein